jgi:uncharacterized protein
MGAMLEAVLPENLNALAAAGLIVASFFTSALTAAMGLGGGVVLLALMAIVMPAATLIPVHGVVQLGSNVGRAWKQRAHISLTIIWPFVIGSLIGAAIGALTVITLPDAAMKIIIAVFILVTAWTKIPGLDRLSKGGIALGSSIIALASMLIGASGPLLNGFFAQLFPGDRKRLVATAAAGMSLHHGLKVVVFGLAGFAFHDWLWLIAAMIATGYAGTLVGTALLDKLPEQTFRTAFKWGLTLLALDMVRRAAGF